MSKSPDWLSESLAQVSELTSQTYNPGIEPVAQAVWRHHLRAENPMWQYLKARPFSFDRSDGAAHAVAMVDSRLPNLGLVGYVAATDTDSGAQVLRQAAEWLSREHGVASVYGPIHGNITRDYRINLDSDYVIPGEPVNPWWHLDAFREAGFEVYNRYVSGRSNHYRAFVKLFVRQPPAKVRANVALRPFAACDQERDLRTYHELMNAIFPAQSIYCPVISWEERLYNMTGPNPVFNPQYSYFLEKDGEAIGFVVAYPHNGELVLKTIGLAPKYRGQYLSGLMIHRVHDQARADGLTSAIYSTIRVGNSVYKMRGPGVKLFRHYVTMRKQA